MAKAARNASAFDRVLLQVAPGWAASRAQNRMKALAYRQAYEAAEKSHLRQSAREFGSGNAIVSLTGTALRNQARHLYRNHDIIKGGLDTVVQNIVGPHGINIVPAPRDRDGNIVESVVDQILLLLDAWAKKPEVTTLHDWASVQRLLALTWLRDGEAFAQEVRGFVPTLEHGSAVPFSLELLEPDLIPIDFDDPARRIQQGIERNAWGRPVAYHLYKGHPGAALGMLPDTKRVPADLIRHVRTIARIGQVRGISILASTFTRIEDLKDYEESERIAAKIAASMAAVIIKGDPTLYNPDLAGDDGERRMRMQPGMIFDNLRPGESVQSIDSTRPNTNLEAYRDGQLRAIAAPMRVSFSSLAKNYNGTYSAQRQELVEQYGAYGVLANEFISQMVRPIYERFVAMAVLAGELILPRGMSLAAALGADYLSPPMPWIDPVKEITANEMAEKRLYKSRSQIIREAGRNPTQTLQEIARDRDEAEAFGLQREDAPATAPVPPTPPNDGE